MTIALILITGLVFDFSVSYSAVILIYHKFGEKNSPSTSVSMKDFEKQMEYLKTHNYTVVPLQKIVDYLYKRKPLPPKFVAITIDDGYRSTMKAFRILKKYGYPFTLFLYAEGVGRYPAYLTKKQLRELARYPGITFGCHSYSHKRLAFLLKDMPLEEYKKFIEKDTLKAQERIKKLTGVWPKFYAFPYGDYNRVYIEVLKNLGFKALFTQDAFPVSNEISPFLIPRIPVVGSWSRMKNFKKMIERETLPVVSHFPEIGFLETDSFLIKAFIKEPERFKNCQIYVTEKGWIPAWKMGNLIQSKTVIQVSKLRNRIAIKCFDKKTKKEAFYIWMILYKNGTWEDF